MRMRHRRLQKPIEFGFEYFNEKDECMVKPKAWLGGGNTMAVETNSLRLQSLMSCFDELKSQDASNEYKVKPLDELNNAVEGSTTVKATFGTRYLRDILDFLEEWGERVEIQYGNNVPMMLKVKDDDGIYVKVFIAPHAVDEG